MVCYQRGLRRLVLRLEQFVFKKIICSYQLDNFRVVEMSDFDKFYDSYSTIAPYKMLYIEQSVYIIKGLFYWKILNMRVQNIQYARIIYYMIILVWMFWFFKFIIF